jgi:hypothetical protein
MAFAPTTRRIADYADALATNGRSLGEPGRLIAAPRLDPTI